MKFSLPNRPNEIQSVIIPDPLVVGSIAPVAEAIHLMSGLRTTCPFVKETWEEREAHEIEMRSSCVLVVEEGRLLGILTERDVVRLMAQKQSFLHLPIRQVMTHPVITVCETECIDIFSVANLFHQHRIRHLPVLNPEGLLVGLLTHESLQRIASPAHLLRLRRVQEVMTSDVICAYPFDPILKVAALMTEHQVSSVVIIQGTENVLGSPIPLGLITERDLVQFQSLSLIAESIVAETVMSTPLFTIHLEDTLWNVHQLMLQRFISRLVVVGEQGELLGIVTQTSLLKVLDPKELYALTEALETKVSQLESEKIALLEARTLELEQQVEQAVAYQQMQTQLAEQQRTEADLRRSEQFYAALANASPVGIFRTNATGQYTYVNERWCEITGLNPLVTPQLSWSDGLYPSDRKKILKGWTILTDPNRILTVECRYQKTERPPTWVLVQVAAEHNALGDIVGFVGTIFDISDRKLTEKQLRQALDTNQAVLSAIPDLILRVSRDGIFRSIVPKKDVTLLAPIYQHLGKHLVEVLPLELAQERVAMVEEAFRTGRTQNQEYSLWIQGELHHEEARCVVCGVDEVLFLVRDITERKESESQLLYNSLHDTLTRLPNRSQLIQRIELALLRVQRAEIHSFAVLFLDLDRFKNINDSLGHLVGDQLLVKVAQRLQSKIRAVDLAARLGGDEFVILLEDLPNIQNSIQVAEKILNEFQIPIILNQREIIIIGIGRIFTNPPSHTTHRAAPQWAVPSLTARQTD